MKERYQNLIEKNHSSVEISMTTCEIGLCE